MAGGLVAITDNANPAMHVAFHRRSDGGLVCQTGVFEDDESATESSLVAVGGGVVVQNNHGYSGPVSTMLGRTTDAGLARVDVVGGKCVVRWTSDQAAPSAGPRLSLANGLLYTYTKRHSWWGANAWYLTALDVRTGRSVFSVRTGLGSLLDGHYGGGDRPGRVGVRRHARRAGPGPGPGSGVGDAGRPLAELPQPSLGVLVLREPAAADDRGQARTPASRWDRSTSSRAGPRWSPSGSAARPSARAGRPP